MKPTLPAILALLLAIVLLWLMIAWLVDALTLPVSYTARGPPRGGAGVEGVAFELGPDQCLNMGPAIPRLGPAWADYEECIGAKKHLVTSPHTPSLPLPGSKS